MWNQSRADFGKTRYYIRFDENSFESSKNPKYLYELYILVSIHCMKIALYFIHITCKMSVWTERSRRSAPDFEFMLLNSVCYQICRWIVIILPRCFGKLGLKGMNKWNVPCKELCKEQCEEHVLGHCFTPPLNPVVENTTCTLRTDTDSNESWDLEHKTRAVVSALKPINTYM